MMHEVIGWGTVDGSKQVGHSLRWIKLKSGMTKDLVQYLPSREHSERKRSDTKRQSKEISQIEQQLPKGHRKRKSRVLGSSTDGARLHRSGKSTCDA